MRNALQTTYSVTLRLIGLYGLAHFAIAVIFIENFAQERTVHTVPVAILSIFVLTCVLLVARQNWLPSLVARPRHPLSLVAILLIRALLQTAPVLLRAAP
ncbi:hypothetical protein KUL25_09820 [Rhodobacteraceae bacterium N5(2021)]|uniref:Uncharacterized protein n=1 Tax=Gymnodinialimonas phycosphaerae TaxID=2841589 RepID=A0A975TYV7_9RHOB|nr:hypothetical protein [Gymnodinialimonas phycosphaerae]MBY4893060.1 hypothetical protein [Gymnodinialimonas phycosphaerae]